MHDESNDGFAPTFGMDAGSRSAHDLNLLRTRKFLAVHCSCGRRSNRSFLTADGADESQKAGCRPLRDVLSGRNGPTGLGFQQFGADQHRTGFLAALTSSGRQTAVE